MITAQPSVLAKAASDLKSAVMGRVIVRKLGLAEYEPTWRAMQDFNRARTPETRDEIWLLEHPPVFTLGLAGKSEHVLNPGNLPVVKTDRGGQVTYHGPGQLVCYLMLDLPRLGYGVKDLVRRMEASVITLLASYSIEARREPGMPGVYLRSGNDGMAKISAVGLRVANHATYHGLALNVDMDLEPFLRINPCGYAGLQPAQMKDQGVSDSMERIGDRLVSQLVEHLF